ncbi:MAG: type III pantothenate kinase [Bacteroidetes bacterium]|nr:type III pantothenate kinase [Bacteroidota bacterium]
MIYLDVGNSFIKMASHAGDITGDEAGLHQNETENWIVHLRAPHADLNKVLSLLNTELLTQMPVMACSVVESVSEALRNALGSRITFARREWIPDSLLDYHSPDTLGMDRFMACLGAWSLSKRESVIVIDAGTATTIDLMTGEGVFRGGVIMPGIKLFEQGLQHFAPALPKVPRELPSQWPPKSTVQALQWGITGSYLEAVKAHVSAMQQDSARIWITGGDADVLAQIRNVELHYHPNLVFEGLRAWVNHQADQR